MTTSRELVIKTLRHESVKRTPRDVWYLQGIDIFRRDEFDKFIELYPLDFLKPKLNVPVSEREKPLVGLTGKYTDAWGCTWEVMQPGVIGEVKEPPLADWSALEHYKLPYDVLDNTDYSQVNPICTTTDKFVLPGSSVRPFERLQFLRGSEAVYLDLAYGSNEISTILEMLHEYYVKELKMWAQTDVDGISFMDDWGSQYALLISPDMWRDMFKPLYKDYCDILHEKGKWVFFHTDGNVSAIYGDLIEVGVDAINSQLFCMDIEELGDKYSGKVTFWGEIDRQEILPFGSVEDVRNAVRRVRNVLDKGSGGIIAQCEWGMDVPYENMVAVYDEWMKPLI